MREVTYNDKQTELDDELEPGYKELDLFMPRNNLEDTIELKKINLEDTIEFNVKDSNNTQELHLGDNNDL